MSEETKEERRTRLQRESYLARKEAGQTGKTPEQKARDAELSRIRYRERKLRAAENNTYLYSEDALVKRRHAEWVRSQWRQFAIEFNRYLDALEAKKESDGRV